MVQWDRRAVTRKLLPLAGCIKTSWNLCEKHVTAKRDWDEERATIEFKKLAGVQQSLPCKLRVQNQKGEKVPFEINTTFSYTLVVAR
jgi:hypothetical protein